MDTTPPFPLCEVQLRKHKDLERSLTRRGFDIEKLRAAYYLLPVGSNMLQWHTYLCGVEAGIYYMMQQVKSDLAKQEDY